MRNSRRNFIRNSVMATGAIVVSSLLPTVTNAEDEEQRIIILHTNDLHSHLEPFPMDGSTNQGLGGVAARAAIVEAIRSKNEEVLLLDAGDIFSGTTYFDLYKGEPEIKAMSLLKYDAATIGESDLSAGIDNYVNKIKQYANFAIVVCNYDCSRSSLNSIIQSYKVFQKGNVKIGVTGTGIDLQGLLPDDISNEVKYIDPVESLNRTADILKRKENCDMVICLSHLGDKYYDGKMSDDILARETEDTDLIIGGHTHRFFDEPRKYVNRKGREIIVNQAGWAGMQLGRLDYKLLKNEKRLLNAKTILLERNYED